MCLRGEDFDNEKRRVGEDVWMRFGSSPGPYEDEVRDADAGSGDLGSKFGSGLDVPLLLVLPEPDGQQSLQPGVLPLAHVALQDLAVDVFTVGTVDGVLVVGDGDDDGGGHGASKYR